MEHLLYAGPAARAWGTLRARTEEGRLTPPHALSAEPRPAAPLPPPPPRLLCPGWCFGFFFPFLSCPLFLLFFFILLFLLRCFLFCLQKEKKEKEKKKLSI